MTRGGVATTRSAHVERKARRRREQAVPEHDQGGSIVDVVREERHGPRQRPKRFEEQREIGVVRAEQHLPKLAAERVDQGLQEP